MKRPPIIVLMADQLRADVLGAYGSVGLHNGTVSPHIDQLSSRSAVFTRHYTPCPLCVPARTSFMTGLHTHQHGAIINGWKDKEHGQLKPGFELLPAHLAEAGYRVAHIGVQHVHTTPDIQQQMPEVEFIGPCNTGDHFRALEARGLMLGDINAFRVPIVDYDHGEPIIGTATGTNRSHFPLREDFFYDSTLAAEMVKLISEHDGKKPLALFGMFWLPHPPLWSPQKWANLVDPDAIKLPVNIGAWYKGQPVMQLQNIPGRLGVHVTREEWLEVWAAYLGMVGLLDQCVNHVLKALRDAGMIDDALIVFTSDHGEMLGAHAMFQKFCLYDEAARVPLLLKLPGQVNGRAVSDLTDHLDLAATLLTAAGARPLSQSPGHSLIELAEGRTNHERGRDYVFAAYDGNAGRGFAHRMVRTPSHKFIHNISDKPELYDLVEDPREARNLAGKEDAREVEEHLREVLSDWMDKVGDDLPRCRVSGQWVK